MNTVSLFHYLLALMIWWNESLFLYILNTLFTGLLHFPSVFTHGFIPLLFNVMNRIKIINQTWLGLIFSKLVISWLWNNYNDVFSEPSCNLWAKEVNNNFELLLPCIYVIKLTLGNQFPHAAYSIILLSMECFPINKI